MKIQLRIQKEACGTTRKPGNQMGEDPLRRQNSVTMMMSEDHLYIWVDGTLCKVLGLNQRWPFSICAEMFCYNLCSLHLQHEEKLDWINDFLCCGLIMCPISPGETMIVNMLGKLHADGRPKISDI